jgi:[acyl-carrier-protein] S-malonyltransferase
MLVPWRELPAVREQLEEFSTRSGIDLVAHGTESDADTIRDTSVAQPLIVASSLIALRAIVGDATQTTQSVAVTAGHSVGEFAAAAVAGVVEDASAVDLVSHRARFMAEAAAATPTGMSAVVGGVAEEVLAAIEAAGLTPANVNAAGQIVAAGSLEGLETLAQNAPARARVMPLKVAGAFHTHYMNGAFERFSPVAADWAANDPQIALLSNRDGKAFTSGTHGHGTAREVLNALANQIISPVRWDLCQEELKALGVTGILELAPGGVLTGIAKRSLPDIERFAVKSAGDVEEARAFVAAHGTGN